MNQYNNNSQGTLNDDNMDQHKNYLGQGGDDGQSR